MAGGILFGTQALFKSRFDIHCISVEKTRILILNVNDIESVAEDNAILRNSINRVRGAREYINIHTK